MNEKLQAMHVAAEKPARFPHHDFHAHDFHVIIDLFGNSKIVIPAPDQVEGRLCRESIRRLNPLLWIPAYAGMTVSEQV